MRSPATLSVRAAALTGFAGLCRSHGADPARLLRAVGLSVDAEREPDRRVPVSAVNQLFEQAAAACGIDDFGLRLAALRGFANLGPIGLIARDEPTIGAAFAAIEAYLPHHNDALATTRERFGAVVVLRSSVLGPGPKTQATDIAVAMQHRILAELAGPGWQADEVCLSRAPPADPARFRRALGPRVRFAAEFDGIVVQAELFERANPMAQSALRSYTAAALQLPDPGHALALSDRVRAVLALRLASGRCTAGFVAGQLGISRRTLTRQLAAEGTRFKRLLNEARRDAAERLLAVPGRSLGDISDLLGFAAPAAFSTWFRQQHGIAPRVWRSSGGS